MALGDLVKDLILRFKVDGWQLAKDKIDSIPDEKTIKLDMDSSAFGGTLESLKMKLMGAGYDSGQGFWRAFFSRLAYSGFGKMNLPGFLPNLPSFFTSAPGILAIAAAAGTLLTFVDQLASGFVAAGMGLAAFAALAYPTFSTISGAVTKINTDTATYDAATTKAARSAALKTIKADWAALDPVQKTAVQNVIALQSQWDTLAADFEKQIAPILSTLLQGPQKEIVGFNRNIRGRAQPIYGMSSGGVVYQILQDLPKFANIAARALTPLINAFNQFLSSPGAKAFMSQMQAIEKLALPAIGQGIGQVALAIGKLFTVFSAKDDARAIKVAFDIIVGAIDAVVFVLKTLQGMWDATSRLLGPVLRYMIDRAREWWRATAGAVGDVIHAWDNFRHFVAVAATDIWHAITTILNPGKLAAFLVNSGRAIIDGLIAGIKAAIPGLTSVLGWVTHLIPSWKGPLDRDRTLLVPNGQAIMQGLMTGIGSQVPALHGQLGGITSGIAGAAGRGYARGGGDTYNLTVNGFVGNEHQLAVEIQRALLSLKRRRFGQGATGSGLGLA